MLNERIRQWQAATSKSAVKLLCSEKNTKGITVFQKQLIRYRDVPIIMTLSLIKNTSQGPVYAKALTCESTTKTLNLNEFERVVDGKRVVDMARKMAAIEVLITPGFDYERKVEHRETAKRQMENAKRINEELNANRAAFNEAMGDLTASNKFSPADRAFIERWLTQHTDEKQFSLNIVAIKALVDQRELITGEDLVTRNVFITCEPATYIKIAYNEMVRHLLEAEKKDGGWFGQGYIDQLSSGPRRKNNGPDADVKPFIMIPETVERRYIRQMSQDIWRCCLDNGVGTHKGTAETNYRVTSRYFLYVIRMLCDFYAYKTGITIEQMMMRIKQSKQHAADRKAGREFSGRTYGSGPRTWRSGTREESVITVGDAVGNVLDEAMSQPKRDRRAKLKKDEQRREAKAERDYSDDERDNYPPIKEAVVVTAHVESQDSDNEPEPSVPENSAPAEEPKSEDNNLGSMSDAFGDLDI